MKTFFLAIGLLISNAAFSQESRVVPAPQDPGATPIEYSVRANEVLTGSAVAFRPGTATLLPSSERALQTIVKYLTDKSYITGLRIEGHTVCGSGSQALSESRAKAVADWLVAQGVDCKRLVVAGFGCTKPLMADHAELNERIQFYNVSLRNHLIGGMPAAGGGKEVALQCP